MSDDYMGCPNCGDLCARDEVDVGVGIIYGPWGCACGWSEYEEYNLIDGSGGLQDDGGYLSPQGGYYPPDSLVAKMAQRESKKE